MALDQVENFVEVNVAGDHSDTETTISLQTGEASNLPDPANGEYNLVWFNSTNFSRPSDDDEVEIVRVTARDTNNDTITVQRGQENTTAVAHDTSNSDYVMILAYTAKTVEDIDAANFSTNSVTIAGNNVTLGSSTAVDHSDLSNIGASDHHTKYTDENAQDAFGSMLTGQQSLINVTYDDANNEVDFVVQEANIDHDSLSGFVSNEHINHSNVSISAGTHLTGGGNITASRTLNVDETGIEADNLAGNNGTNGQFLQTDGSNLTFADVTTFSGNYNDLTNVPELPEGLSLNEYRAWQNKVASNIAENDFENGLDALNYPDGFYDIFVDQSKIASTTGDLNVSTGTNGLVSLTGEGTVQEFDSFEDGDFTNNPSWNELNSNGTATVQSSVVKNGSFSLELSTNGSGEETLQIDRNGSDSISNGDIYQGWFYVDSNERAEFALSNTSGDIFGSGAVNIFADLRSGETSIKGGYENDTGGIGSLTLESSANLDVWYKFEIEIIDTSGQVEFRLYDSSETLINSATASDWQGETNLRYVILSNRDFGSGTVYFDDISYSEELNQIIGTSGTLTSTAFNLGYQATKWTPTADYQLNGQNIDYFELQEGDGTTIAQISESQIGDTIDISTTATSYQLEISLSGDGTDTPQINKYENGLDD